MVWLNAHLIQIKTTLGGGLAQCAFDPDQNQCTFSVNTPIQIGSRIESGLKAQCEQAFKGVESTEVQKYSSSRNEAKIMLLCTHPVYKYNELYK